MHTVFKLLSTYSWQELRHHPWRNAAAIVTVMLGVALALSVHLINASALDEFASAARMVNGQPDLEVRATRGSLDEALFERMARHPGIALVSPVLEINTLAATNDTAPRSPLRILGVDALTLAQTAPALMPRPSPEAGRLALFAPDTLFLNPAALALWGTSGPLHLQNGLRLHPMRIAGTTAASGPALAVMDIAAAQDLFQRHGQLTRIDLRLRPGLNPTELMSELQQQPDWPPGVYVSAPTDMAQQVGSLSRAYRVNLTVLALVALFTGAFLVFSVLALSVAKRAQQLALLGVLGLTPRERLRLILSEALVLGLLGSLAGIALGTALAALVLRILGGDLGGGYFSAVTPSLQWSTPAALVYGALGTAAALAGGWWPARAAQQLPEAQTLKGLGAYAPPHVPRTAAYTSLLLLLASAVLAATPPLWGIPIAAYISIALLLLGGITALPWLTAVLYNQLAPRLGGWLLPMLAIERARRMRGSAAIAISGIVAALSLAVALTVMVASFRHSVTQWLDQVLPADLYLRTTGTSNASDTAYFTPEFMAALSKLPGVQHITPQRTSPLQLDPTRPAIVLIARPLGDDPARSLPLTSASLLIPPGQIGIYVSEAMADLYNARPGGALPVLSQAFASATEPPVTFFVAGVWRDYARQTGSLVINQADYLRLTQDPRANDLALQLKPGTDLAQFLPTLRATVAEHTGSPDSIEIASTADIRSRSLVLFDRSFAVTYWLQAVAIGIGLFGVAASFSAQILARRKEFGLLTHLGFTQRQIRTVVAGEGAAWTLIGSIAGLLLGLAIALILIHIVNPQSFHWTMDVQVPWLRLLATCCATILAGTATAWLAARSTATHHAVMAVKEDW